MPESPDARWNRWGAELERIIREVYTANHFRNLWRGLIEITQATELPPSAIFDAFGVWYATTQTAAVRRQLDRRKDVVSLWRLLDNIARNPGTATRERHVALWRTDDERDFAVAAFKERGHENFDRFSGGRHRDTIDAALVRDDLKTLSALGGVVERYVNEAIAANERARQVPTYAELNAAIDEIGRLVTKYASLLKATILIELGPVIQHDWKAPFRQPWIPEGS